MTNPKNVPLPMNKQVVYFMKHKINNFKRPLEMITVTIAEALCTRITYNFHKMSLLIVSYCLQKINVSFRDGLGAMELKTQEKCLKLPKMGATHP